MLAQDLSTIAPELTLAVAAMAALMWGAFGGKSDPSRLIHWVMSILLVVIGLWISFQSSETRTAFSGSFVSDDFARFSKVLILFGAAATLALSHEYLDRVGLLKFEYSVIVALSVIGMMIMVSASDLIVLYMGLELQSLALYVVAAFRRDNLKSTEAGLKYFVLGSLSSGLLLYGASLTYGFAGTTDFAGIATVIGQDQLPLGLLFGLVFLTAGMAFKVSAAPFHMWTPDVYEGAPTPVTAFFATAPKVAAAAMLARVLFDAFGGAVADWQQILALLAVASMFLGSIAAIGQRDIKRLMAYSSIAHMGYALLGLASGTQDGVQALLIYLAIYVVTNIGVFTIILNMERNGEPVTDIYALGMYSRAEPLRAFALAMMMISLAGVPFFAGFFAKFEVFKAAVDAGLVWIVVAGGVASVIGLYYYLRIVYIMYFGQQTEALDGTMPRVHRVLLAASFIGVVFYAVRLFDITPLAAIAAAALVN